MPDMLFLTLLVRSLEALAERACPTMPAAQRVRTRSSVRRKGRK
jgi:hypothetical protein